MKRRVLVAQALVHKPPVIILDEPTAGVDVELRQALWRFMRELNRAGHTIVLTTHYLEEAEALCGRIAMLKQGRIVALDTTRNLLRGVSGCARASAAVARIALPDSRRSATLTHAKTATAACWRWKTTRRSKWCSPSCARRASKSLELEVLQPDLEEVFVQMMHRH